MAVPFSNTKLRVPKGFQNVLEGLTREVLRTQPDDIFEFGMNYFEGLLRVRTETGHDIAVHGAKQEDRAYNNWAFKQERDSKPQDGVTMQSSYRAHHEARTENEMRQEEAAIKIQAGFRGTLAREEIKKKKEEAGKPTAAQAEGNVNLNNPEVEAAAVKIQAGFKGYKARKDVQDMKAEDK